MAEFVLHYDALTGRINVTSPGGALKREQGTYFIIIVLRSLLL